METIFFFHGMWVQGNKEHSKQQLGNQFGKSQRSKNSSCLSSSSNFASRSFNKFDSALHAPRRSKGLKHPTLVLTCQFLFIKNHLVEVVSLQTTLSKCNEDSSKGENLLCLNLACWNPKDLWSWHSHHYVPLLMDAPPRQCAYAGVRINRVAVESIKLLCHCLKICLLH